MSLREPTEQAMMASPHKQLIDELLDSRIPKSEREHAAAREIERLRQELVKPEQEPVAYVTGYSKGYAVVQPVDRSLLMPVGMVLYRSPPTSQESRQVEATIKQSLIVEPVRWMVDDVVFKNPHTAILTAGALNKTVEPLYVAPPKREPLTEKQIEAAVCGAYVEKALTRYDITIARAIERAHGIWGEE